MTIEGIWFIDKKLLLVSGLIFYSDGLHLSDQKVVMSDRQIV